jgi:hypothetical protein
MCPNVPTVPAGPPAQLVSEGPSLPMQELQLGSINWSKATEKPAGCEPAGVRELKPLTERLAVAECRRYAIAHRVLKSEFALQRAGRAVRDPIPTPKGKPLLTLKDAAAYIMTLPKKVSDVSMPASSYRRCTSPAQQ